MAYKLSLAMGCGRRVLGKVVRYCVQIISPDGAGADYEWSAEPHGTRSWDWPPLRVRSWDTELGGPTASRSSLD